MGYEMTMIEADVTIPKENETEAMKALMEHDGEYDWQSSSFDDLDPESRSDTLVDVLERLRLKAERVEDGTEIIRFTGQKIGSEKRILNALAPYVSDGSYLHFGGQYDNHEWRWVVKGDEVFEIEPDVEWPDPTSEGDEVVYVLMIHPYEATSYPHRVYDSIERAEEGRRNFEKDLDDECRTEIVTKELLGDRS